MIKLSHVRKAYQIDNDVEFVALHDISLEINRGEFTALVGPSGSGKSTLMHIIGLLDLPTSGEIVINGDDISHLDDNALSTLRNEFVGFVFQQFNLINKLTVLENVLLPTYYARKKLSYDPEKRAMEILDRFGIGSKANSRPNRISGGQQQRVAIARAIENEPAMILADEPTGNLDSRSGTEVMQIFQTMNREKGITTVFVTHDPWIARHTNRVIMLRDGVVVADRKVATPLVAGETERPSEAEELEGVFQEVYYGGKEEEYN